MSMTLIVLSAPQTGIDRGLLKGDPQKGDPQKQNKIVYLHASLWQ